MPRFFFCVLTAIFLLPGTAFAIEGRDDEYGEFAKALNKLQGEIDELELFLMMPAYETKLDTGICSSHIKAAEKHLQAAKDLNIQFKDHPTTSYQKKINEHKEQNAFAIEAYKKCFTDEIRSSTKTDKPIFERTKVTDYYTFISKKAALSDKFQWSSGLAEHLANLKELIATLQSEGTDRMSRNKVGIVKEVSGEVKVNRLGGQKYSKSTDWIQVKTGDTIFVGDHIKSGLQSFAQINFTDKPLLHEKAPTIMSLGASSYIVISEYLAANKDGSPFITGAMTLIRGAMRLLTHGWKNHNIMRISGGPSLCGIRGTDISINYDPEKDKLEYLLDHGKVEISTPGGSLLLSDKQTLKVQNGKLGTVGALSMVESKSLLAVNTGGLQIK